MKILHWNVNGLRAIIKKNVDEGITFSDFINNVHPDIICLNETKLSSDPNTILKEYKYQYYSISSVRKGYSGVAILSKVKPIKRLNDFDDKEGRIICLEYSQFFIICVYVPHAGPKLKRIEFKTEWYKSFYNKIKKLYETSDKEIIIASDFNCAINDIDVFEPNKHKNHAGFTDIEKKDYNKLISIGLYDPFRLRYPDSIEYSYFDYRTKARERNRGWYIDKFLVTSELTQRVKNISILHDIYGSDHLPILIEIE